MRTTLLCLAALLAAAIFLFSVTNGNLSVYGDDALIFGKASFYRPNAGYLLNVSSRTFLTPTYIRIYEAMGSDPWATHLLFLCLHVLNVMLCFLALHRIFEVRPAMVGALFYLVYAGPHETVTWISAGGYLIVMAVFFLSVWIALSDANPWTKGIAIALLNWGAVHLYEVMIVAAPLYPILTAAYWWRKQRRIPWREFVPTLLPLAVLLNHWLLMFVGRRIHGGQEIWMRNPALKTDAGSLLSALMNTGTLGFSTCCGAIHWGFLSTQLRAIFAGYSFGVWYFVSLVIAAAAIGWVWVRNAPAASQWNTKYALTLFTAAYLILVSPLVAFTIVDIAFPSRLLVLCAAGLSLLAATLVARWPNGLVLGLILSVGAAEGLGLQSVLVQEQTLNEVDSGIRNQLQSLRLTPRLGDRFFFSLPNLPERGKLWRASYLRFETGDENVFLVLGYGFLPVKGVPFDDRIVWVRSQIRGEGSGPELNVPVPAAGESRQLFAFAWTDNGRLRGFTPVEVRAGDRVLRRYENPQLAALPGEKTQPGEAAAAWYKNGELRLNFYEPDLLLEIRGTVYEAPAGAGIEVKDQGHTVAVLPVKATGDFIGTVPLTLLKPDSVITLNPAGVNWTFKTTTFTPQP